MIEVGIPQRAVSEVIAREQQELERRERLYRAERPRPSLRGRTAILVDDGLATGSTGECYEEFAQTSDDEVRRLLSLAQADA